MSKVAYRNLLFKIGQQFSKHNHQQLLQICELDHDADNIPDARSLLKRLQEESDGRLEIDQLGVLEDVLADLHEFTLLEELKAFEKKRKEYTKLLAKVRRALDSDERIQLEQLKAICREEETSLELDESISDIQKLFHELQRRGKVGFRRLNLLKTILSQIEKEDLVREIEEYEERRNQNDVAERRTANSWRRALTEGVRQVVRLKTLLLVGRKALTFAAIMANYESVGQFFIGFAERVLPSGTELADMAGGCVCFTIQANSLEGLTTLWNMYQVGTLKARLYDFLVTDKVKHLAEAEENVELTVTIEEEEYRRACIDLNNEARGDAKVLKRKHEHSDSVISTAPNEDETLPIKVKILENDVRFLKEIMKSQMKEEGQKASYEGLADKPRGGDEHKWNFTKIYVDNLQLETKSLMSETTDGGMGTEGAPSEFDVDIGDKRDTQTVADDEWNSLSSAVRTGNFAVIEDMLSRGLNINAKNKDGNTALILAASTGIRDAVDYLLNKGADPFIVSHSGMNPLHAASVSGSVPIIETVMLRGLDVESKSKTGATPLMLAAACGKIEAVNYLLDKGADPQIRNDRGKNLLHAASKGGNVGIIETVMSRGLKVDSRDDGGRTPSMVAATLGKVEAVKCLLDKGANPYITDQYGRNLLHAASKGNDVTIIETVMSRGLAADSRTFTGRTPLMYATASGKSEAVNYLLNRGADPLTRDHFGKDLLHAASEGGNVDIITKMLSFGLNVNSKDIRGRTPLNFAKQYLKTEAVNFLLSKGGH